MKPLFKFRWKRWSLCYVFSFRTTANVVASVRNGRVRRRGRGAEAVLKKIRHDCGTDCSKISGEILKLYWFSAGFCLRRGMFRWCTVSPSSRVILSFSRTHTDTETGEKKKFEANETLPMPASRTHTHIQLTYLVAINSFYVLFCTTTET